MVNSFLSISPCKGSKDKNKEGALERFWSKAERRSPILRIDWLLPIDVPIHTLSHPLPQSSGRWSAIRSGLLVRIWKVCCGHRRMIFHISSLNESHSGWNTSVRLDTKILDGSLILSGRLKTVLVFLTTLGS